MIYLYGIITYPKKTDFLLLESKGFYTRRSARAWLYDHKVSKQDQREIRTFEFKRPPEWFSLPADFDEREWQ